MAPAELESLLRDLHDRNIAANEDAIYRAFQEPDTRDGAVAWVREYLQSSTLLTRDELEHHANKKSVTQRLEYSSGQPLSDAQLEAAIDSLEASTAAIEKQSAILESQKQALKEIKARNAASRSATYAKDAQEKKSTRERAQLDFDIDEASQATNDRIRSSIRQTASATSSVLSQVERLLEKDDRLLDGLQKLLPKISDSSNDSDDSSFVEQLCATLASLSVDELRSRLNRVYCESLSDYSRQQNGHMRNKLDEHQTRERNRLRAELDELGSEVDGLIGIVIDHQYRKPLKEGLLSAQADLHSQRARWAEYSISALAYLTARLDALGDHVHQLHSHNSALQAASSALDNTLASAQVKAGAGNAHPSPSMERTPAKGLKPLRLVQANRSENQDPAIPLLRQHDIRISETESASKVTEMLDRTLREKDNRLAGLASSTERILSDTLSHSLASIDTELHAVSAAVYANSQYGTIHLVEQPVKSRLNSLENSTQTLGDQMRNLDTDAIVRATTAKQDKVIRRLAEG